MPAARHSLAVFLPRARRQGDDRQMAPRGPLVLANCLHDLEAVQLRHVDVQEQQVEVGGQRSEVRSQRRRAFTAFCLLSPAF